MLRIRSERQSTCCDDCGAECAESVEYGLGAWESATSHAKALSAGWFEEHRKLWVGAVKQVVLCPQCHYASRVEQHMAKIDEIGQHLPQLLNCHDCWSEHSDFSREDWQSEVANGDTNLGYWQWVASQIVRGWEDAISNSPK